MRCLKIFPAVRILYTVLAGTARGESSPSMIILVV